MHNPMITFSVPSKFKCIASTFAMFLHSVPRWELVRCVRRLPVENLIEVVSLRVLDAESLNCLVVSLSYVVSNVLVVVLCCTGVDVYYAWRDLASCRVLKVCEVEWRYVSV